MRDDAHLPAFKHLGVEVAFGEIDRAGTRADRQRAESGREESRFAHLLLLLLLLLWCIKSERVEKMMNFNEEDRDVLSRKEVRKGELSATNTTASSFAFFSTACYSAVRNQTRSLSFSFSFSLSVGRFVSSIL